MRPRRINFWNEEKIIEELNELYRAGHKITDRNLRVLKRNDLSGAISRYGSISYFKKIMGFPVKTKKNWSEHEIIETYRELYNKIGKIPTVNHLREHSLKELEYAIYEKFQRLTSLRVAANLVDNRKVPGYWTMEKVESELKLFCIKYKNEIEHRAIGPLVKKYNPKLYSSIHESGGFNKLNKKLKLGLKLSSGDWTTKEICSELKKLQFCKIAINEKNF